jgi:hypothetical protein
VVNELKLGPTQSDNDKRIAFEEIQRKLNEIIRVLNSLSTSIGSQ